MKPHARGFTLIEAMLALAIFGVIAVLSYRATAALTEGEARLSAEAQRWHALEALFTRFEADIRQAIPRSVRVGALQEPAWLGTLGPDQSSALTFTRAGSEFHVEPGAAGQRLGYRLRNGILELAYWPHLDHVDNAPIAIYPLLDNVAAFRLEYLGGKQTWQERWPTLGEPDVPRAVRLSLTLADGTQVERWFALR
jgi:general secretion pathway protein J